MADTSFFHEAQAMAEFLALHRDPMLRGTGMPRGSGRRVLVLPGLMGNDLYLTTVRHWLSRIGYQPLSSDILLNLGCAKRMATDVQAKLEPLLAEDRSPIAILGHSRGGLLAKALATRLGKQVSHLILVGSPLGGFLNAGPEGVSAFAESMEQGNDIQRWVINAGLAATRLVDADCTAPRCGCEYYTDLFGPLAPSTKVTAIYSNEDPVVPPSSAKLPFGKNIVIDGTHSGLMFSPAVYPHIADALAG
ncbi:MAG: hypothetical protein GKR90_24845 [Pseudomonadales bacterium]|nr:hypothetical protein [Pseudomonadales bacterium]